MLKLADTSLILINPSPSNVKLKTWDYPAAHFIEVNFCAMTVCRQQKVRLARRAGMVVSTRYVSLTRL